ncbi:hypothetical protein FNW02_03945 [Komarekiella sp. 'clone 1']|uniref:Beta-glucuronidase C-terminal domain-containing protein n=1 Tax=Komarekiella delphini-convector SJRDD-AB1 TaxID=2593771 RepID=A0AA40SU07_9NOST|nr:glycosyl hydrolase family protein [Komarekiella delphini-convector]MBD6615024.1 hypothetical protein [Komarekiella delphini-convector SJRDD-AB1]
MELSNSNTSVQAIVTINANQPGITIPFDFIGLSYEAATLPRSIFFRTDNILLRNFVKQLSSKGVLRIGGNSVDNTFWIDSSKAISATQKQIITKNDIDNLFDFARIVDWKVILGINLAQSEPKFAALQAEYVALVAADRLLSFAIGNEPDLYSSNGLRPSTYSYNEFRQEFTTYLNAIRNSVADAPISGPSTTAVYGTWAVPFAKDMGSGISLLTQHHYPKGPPNNPSVTISNLLSPDQRLDYLLQNLRIAAQQQGLKYRITESNSVFSGGKEGVSNVFAAALWATDFMFILAQNGAMGVNFHGGGLGLYTPIAEEINKNFFARPLYYGILLFKLASQGRFLPITISQNTLNLKVYAVLGWNNNVMLTLINKDETQNAQVLIDLQDRITVVSALRLSAPSLSSTSNITLGGSSVNSDGSWTPGSFENIQKSGNYYSVLVPAASAALITLPKLGGTE